MECKNSIKKMVIRENTIIIMKFLFFLHCWSVCITLLRLLMICAPITATVFCLKKSPRCIRAIFRKKYCKGDFSFANSSCRSGCRGIFYNPWQCRKIEDTQFSVTFHLDLWNMHMYQNDTLRG